MSRWWVLALGVLLHVLLQAAPAWESVRDGKSGRDFASYYYAIQVADDGRDPYQTSLLNKAASQDHTRKTVNPYFYPPPFLLGMTWAVPLSLSQAYKASFFLNEALLAACCALLVRAFAVPMWAIALMLASFTPIPDHARMGQANLVALLPALAGLALARTRPWLGGVLVGVAGMLKMSPALFLLYWLIRGQWRPALAAAVTAVALSVAALPLVGWDAQVRFYTEVLPGFGVGDYHGLRVPISLSANHSLADPFNSLWPGPLETRLSETAHRATSATALALLALWAWLFRKRGGDEPAALAALTVLMVVVPVYTYEHHLVFLLLAVGTAARAPLWAFVPLYVMLSWDLSWIRWMSERFPSLQRVFYETKFVGALGMFALNAWVARRAQREK